MKTGMNLLLWTDMVTEQHDTLLGQIKEIGFDAVEIPIFNVADRAPYERLGKRLQSLGLGATAVTVMTPDAVPRTPCDARAVSLPLRGVAASVARPVAAESPVQAAADPARCAPLSCAPRCGAR